MKLQLIFTTPDPSPDMVVNTILGSLDVLFTHTTIYIKEWLKHSGVSRKDEVDFYDIVEDMDIRTLIHYSKGNDVCNIHYSREKDIMKIYDRIIKEEISNNIFMNVDYGVITAFTYFEELYSDKEKLIKEKLLKDIIMNTI